MYCALNKITKVAMKGAGENIVLGQGSYGSIKMLSSLPQPEKYKNSTRH
jgi:hypothetical protein